jgi:hypothetical protein
MPHRGEFAPSLRVGITPEPKHHVEFRGWEHLEVLKTRDFDRSER